MILDVLWKPQLPLNGAFGTQEKKKVSEFDKYVQMAKDLKMINAKIIVPDEVFFDIRAIMKCKWGCEDFFNQTIKCNTRKKM